MIQNLKVFRVFWLDINEIQLIELETYFIETDISSPESSTENLTNGTSDHENTIIDDMKNFENPNSKEEKLGRKLPIKIKLYFKNRYHILEKKKAYACWNALAKSFKIWRIFGIRKPV